MLLNTYSSGLFIADGKGDVHLAVAPPLRISCRPALAAAAAAVSRFAAALAAAAAVVYIHLVVSVCFLAAAAAIAGVSGFPCEGLLKGTVAVVSSRSPLALWALKADGDSSSSSSKGGVSLTPISLANLDGPLDMEGTALAMG